jgi:uncharacterized small protein (DUF1192 family)
MRWLIDLKAIPSFRGGGGLGDFDFTDLTDLTDRDDSIGSYATDGPEDSWSSESASHSAGPYDPLRAPTRFDPDEVDGFSVEELDDRLEAIEGTQSTLAVSLALAGARLKRAMSGQDGVSLAAVREEIARTEAQQSEGEVREARRHRAATRRTLMDDLKA